MSPATVAEQINVLIIDSNRCLSEHIADSFLKHGGLSVSCIVRDGAKAVEMLNLYRPDVLIIDIALPIKDGLAILEDIQASEVMKNGTIIVSTSAGTELTMRRCIELGADYFLMKPFDVDILIKRVMEIHTDKQAVSSNYLSEDNSKTSFRKIDSMIKEFMFKSGISSNLKGYDYLNKAIMFCICDEDALYGLTKVVYPRVGKEFGTDGMNVERAMRHAIQTSWKKGRVQPFFDEIGYRNSEDKKPTTGDFIRTAIRSIKNDRIFF